MCDSQHGGQTAPAPRHPPTSPGRPTSAFDHDIGLPALAR
ncbi:hypothetical protein Ae406Ps2_3154c [Pseudonocardia sp. Ae406_Ps2]|nr:hypothetical protein Ae331Ps2_2773 [Pseudonocardia sp. Ae331_Ps2]OLM03154.1 hypothetical protein Ae406Ps2_3154c [Pseudonocardia sp. Ae406_Ps2]OLM11971.1 hypothetical protein Ae505Ps2_2097 [Pseudonocardia sp. Ae505_Ps2]OLM24710.1 hypothetical protein Ae706Ps2_3143c [Pseudonocardia sp. Ae706_Ps2]